MDGISCTSKVLHPAATNACRRRVARPDRRPNIIPKAPSLLMTQLFQTRYDNHPNSQRQAAYQWLREGLLGRER